MTTYRTVTTIDRIPQGSARCVEVAGREVALFNLAGTVYAIDDRCSHEDAPLSEGEIEGETVVCPWHLARFEIKTGKVLSAPACADVETFAVRVVDGVVQVALDGESGS